MAQLASYRIEREPDLALSIRGRENGWNLLPASRSAASVTASPAGLLLTPAQVQAIPPLSAVKGSAPKFTSIFDPLFDRLSQSFAAHDFAALDRTASALLQKHPIATGDAGDTFEHRIHSFFRYKGKSSTAAERLALIEGVTEPELAQWRRTAHARMDLLKAQALATAVSGIEPPKGADLLGDLRADLAFATLDACYAAMPKRGEQRLLPNGYIDHILGLGSFLPAFTFELEICKTRDAHAPQQGRLGKRLERLRAYEARMDDAVVRATDRDGTESADACPCDCRSETCVPIDPCCGEVRWYVTELLTLRDWTWCYKPSDIAYIENIAPYEARIRTHGFTRTVVETSEDETTSSREEQRDHQVTDRFNLQQELTKNLKASLDVDAKLHYGKSGGPYTFDLNTHGSLSQETAYREAREQVREQVEHATLKMQVQTRKLRARTVTTEQTETNKHKFKNTTAVAAVSKYFWVTQEKRGQLFSHGPRLHIDLLVPSPAMLFSKMEEIKRKAGAPKPPAGPPAKPTLTPKSITRNNYVELMAKNEISEYDEPPPERPAHDPLTFSPKANAGSVSVDIPAGYTATSMDAVSATWTGALGPVPNGYIAFQFGGGLIRKGGPNVSDINNAIISGSGSMSGTVSKYWATSGNSTLQIRINLTPIPVDIGPWQKSLYILIMKKYHDDLEKYEEKYADYEAALKAYNAEQDDKIKGRHPFACEEIMRTELKRSAIFMLCGEMNWPDVMNMDSEMCHYPWPNRTKADKATNEWYFFDRAFDWNLASFTFYDYFRNPICKWLDTYEPDEPNFLFKAFLRAGYCRVMIPVSPGMDEDVKDYLQTGGLWGKTGTWPLDPNDTRWISVIEEIKHSHGCYQQDREGYVEAYENPPGSGQFDSHIKVFTDRYWKIGPPSGYDQTAMNLEIDHQIYIDGVEYRIVSIAPDPLSPPYNPSKPNEMTWIMGLDRRIEFEPHVDPAAAKLEFKRYNWAVGAKYVGAPFHFDLPTDLIWIGDQDNACLPCYPIDCVCEKPAGEVPPSKGDEDDDQGNAPEPHLKVE